MPQAAQATTDAARTEQLRQILRASPEVMQVLEVCRSLAAPDWLLVSGAVYQTVWNHLTGRPPGYGVKDYDLTYFDDSDISWDAKDVVIRKLADAFDEPLRSRVEARNQARVHLWFADHFGEAYTPLRCSAEALERFVSPAFAVGARLEADDGLTIVAPFGLEDVFSMVVRPNPLRPARNFLAVARALADRWPELVIETT